MSPKRRQSILISIFLILCIASLGIGLIVRLNVKNLAPTLKHGIMNGSSFAAVTMFDGSRRVFFQDIDGSLREAITNNPGDGWTSTLKSIEVSNYGPEFLELPKARTLTPLTCFLRYTGEPSEATSLVGHLHKYQTFHITDNHPRFTCSI